MCIVSSYFYAYIIMSHQVGLSTISSNILLFYDIYFGAHIVKCFLTDYVPKGEGKPVRDFKSIASNYIQGAFPVDFICWLPLHMMLEVSLNPSDSRDFLCLGLIRLYRSMVKFDVFNLIQISIQNNIKANKEKIK